MNLFLKFRIIGRCINEVKNWHVPILYYLNIKHGKNLIELKNGLRCYLRDKGDAIAFFENFFLDVNSPSNEFIINMKDVVIDVGAHVGYFTLNASEKAKKGKIFAFEPNSESFNMLQENIEINKIKNAIVVNAGVLDRSGKAELFLSDDYSIGNSMFLEKSDKKEIVNVMSLEEIVKTYHIDKIDFLKLDCEGAEFDIILKLTDELLKKITRISAEIHQSLENHSIKELEEFLSSKGYVVKSIKLLDSNQNLHMLYAIRK